MGGGRHRERHRRRAIYMCEVLKLLPFTLDQQIRALLQHGVR